MTAVLPPLSLVPPLAGCDGTTMVVHAQGSPNLHRADSDATAGSSSSSSDSNGQGSSSCTSHSHNHLSSDMHDSRPSPSPSAPRKSKSQLFSIPLQTNDSSLALADALDRLVPPSSASRRSSIASNSSSNAWKLEFGGVVKLVKWASRRKKSSHSQTLNLSITPARPRSDSKPPALSPVKRGLSLVDALQLGPAPSFDTFPQRVQLVDPSSSTIVHLPAIAPSSNPPATSLVGRTPPEGPSHNNDDLNVSTSERTDHPDDSAHEPSAACPSGALPEVDAFAPKPETTTTTDGVNRVLDLSSDDEHRTSEGRGAHPDRLDQTPDEFGRLQRHTACNDDDDDEESPRRQLHVKRERRRRGLSVSMAPQPTNRVSTAVSAPPVSVFPAGNDRDDGAPSHATSRAGENDDNDATSLPLPEAQDAHGNSHIHPPDMVHDFVIPLSPPASSSSHGHFVGTRSDVGHQLHSPSTPHRSPSKRRPTSAGSGSSSHPRRRKSRRGLPMSVKDSLKRSLTVNSPVFSPIIIGHDPLDPRLLNKAKRQDTLARTTSNSANRPRSSSRLLGSPLSAVSALKPTNDKENQDTSAPHDHHYYHHQPISSGNYGGSQLSVSSFLAGSQPPASAQSPGPKTFSLPGSAHASSVDLPYIPQQQHFATPSHQDDSNTRKKKRSKRRAGTVGANDLGLTWSSAADSWTLHEALDKPAGLIGTTLADNPSPDVIPHPPSTWFNPPTNLFRGANGAQRRPRAERPIVALSTTQAQGISTPPSLANSNRDMPTGLSHSRSVSTSSIASSFFGGLNRARTFSARSHSLGNAAECSLSISRASSVGAKLRPVVVSSGSDSPVKAVLVREHTPPPPVPPLPPGVKTRLGPLTPIDASYNVSPTTPSLKHTPVSESGVSTQQAVTFADPTEAGLRAGRRLSKPESPRQSSLSSSRPPLTTLAFTGTRGYYETQMALEASSNPADQQIVPSEDSSAPQAIGRSLSDPSSSISGGANAPRSSLLVTSPSSPNFVGPRPESQVVSIYDFPIKDSPVPSMIEDESNSIMKTDSHNDLTNLPADEPQPDHPRPPRAHRPTLAHRASSTSAKRWTVAVSGIPDDGEYLKELDRLKQSRDARYSSAIAGSSSKLSLLRGRSTRKPRNSLLGDQATLVSRPSVDEEADSESDSQRGYEGEDPEEEIIWMKARQTMLRVREILRTEINYKNNLISVYEAGPSKVPQLFLEHLPRLISASVSFLSGLEEDPSAWGVSAAFLKTESQLEEALVSWSQVVGQVMLELADNGASSSGFTSFYRKSSGGSKEKKEKGLPSEKDSKKSEGTLVGSIGKRAGKMKSRPAPAHLPSSSRSPFGSKGSTSNGSKPLTVQDIAISPTQRVGRYGLLFNELLQQTPITSPSRALVERALQGAHRIGKACNDAQRHPDLVS